MSLSAAGVDFVPVPEVVFPAGLTGSGCMQCLEITIINDRLYEGDGQLFNVLFDENNLDVMFSDDSTATVYITEDTADGTFMHESSSNYWPLEIFLVGVSSSLKKLFCFPLHYKYDVKSYFSEDCIV